MAGRPSSQTNSRVEIMEFRLNKNDPEQLDLARVLTRTPKGKGRARVRDFMISGFVAHCEENPRRDLAEIRSRQLTPRYPSLQIDKYHFDASDPVQAELVKYLRSAPRGKRRDRMLRLVLKGFSRSQQSQNPQPKEQ